MQGTHQHYWSHLLFPLLLLLVLLLMLGRLGHSALLML
jgi:hypothetical protein